MIERKEIVRSKYNCQVQLIKEYGEITVTKVFVFDTEVFVSEFYEEADMRYNNIYLPYANN